VPGSYRPVCLYLLDEPFTILKLGGCHDTRSRLRRASSQRWRCARCGMADAGGQLANHTYPFSSSTGDSRADSCESIDRYQRPIDFRPRFWLNGRCIGLDGAQMIDSSMTGRTSRVRVPWWSKYARTELGEGICGAGSRSSEKPRKVRLTSPGTMWRRRPSFERPVSCVFVVNEEMDVAHSLSVILRAQGYATSWFTRPGEALAAAVGTPPDLLVSDVSMSDLCGIDFAISIIEASANCRVLLTSGRANSLDSLCRARARGYDFQLQTMPLCPIELILMVRGLLQIGRLSLPIESACVN
jgi:CheY-like chemotaxis protein